MLSFRPSVDYQLRLDLTYFHFKLLILFFLAATTMTTTCIFSQCISSLRCPQATVFTISALFIPPNLFTLVKKKPSFDLSFKSFKALRDPFSVCRLSNCWKLEPSSHVVVDFLTDQSVYRSILLCHIISVMFLF